MKARDVRHSLPVNDTQPYPLDIDEHDQRMKDELDAVVTNKYKRQLADSQELDNPSEDDYEEDFDDLKDKIDNGKDTSSRGRLSNRDNRAADVIIHSPKSMGNGNIDDIDVHPHLLIGHDIPQASQPASAASKSKKIEDDNEEYTQDYDMD